MFSLFGPSKQQRRLDEALREFGLAPQGLDDAVKLTVLRLLRGPSDPEEYEAALRRAAEMLAYCVLGSSAYGEQNGAAAVAALEARLAIAPEAPEGLDARVILLCLHSGYAEPGIALQFDWEGEDG